MHPALVVGLGVLPSLVWLIFYLQQDRKHPEPVWMIIYAFILSGMMTFFALVLQMLARTWFIRYGIGGHSPFELGVFATIEEVLKFLAMYWFISKRKDFDEPLDAMVYMITIALGFAAVENIASLFQSNNVVGMTAGLVTPLGGLALRFFGATLLHSVTSGLIGYHWGLAIVRRRPLWIYLTLGVAMASALHGVFNYLILKTGPGTWAITFAMFIAFFLLGDFEALKAVDD